MRERKERCSQRTGVPGNEDSADIRLKAESGVTGLLG